MDERGGAGDRLRGRAMHRHDAERLLGERGVYNQSSAVAFIQSEAQNWGITIPSANIHISTATSCNGVSGFSQVQLTYTFQSFIPALIDVLSTGQVITGSACFPT